MTALISETSSWSTPSALGDFETYTKYGTGTALTVTGMFKKTPEAKQPFEVEVTELALEGDCDPGISASKEASFF